MTATLVTPERRVFPARRIVGLNRPYQMGHQQGIPAQWGEYNEMPAAGDVVPQAWYGVCHSFDGKGGFEYLCGMQARGTAGLAEGTTQVDLPEGAYACFATKAPISQMQAIWAEVFGHWLTRPEWQARPGPSVEFYPPEFDGETGLGGYEIWVPVV